MTIIQINFSTNIGSTGKIAEQIGELIIRQGWKSYIVSGRHYGTSSSKSIIINNRISILWHVFISHFCDMDGLGSYFATRKLVKKLKKIDPDIIHLHVIHESYINYPVLFQYLAKANIPVVWTFHDCWAFTGHCPHFEFIGCEKWKTHCCSCEAPVNRRKLEFFHRSTTNFSKKKKYFCSIDNMTIVPVSYWLADIISKSFLKEYKTCVIHNGIDTDLFKPKASNLRERHAIATDKFVIIGVANGWGKRKGYDDFISVAKQRPDWQFVMIGLPEYCFASLPSNVLGIQYTRNQEELSEYYNTSDVFLNTTYEDTYPTVNLEALSCGTPVVTYKTGGSPESVTPETGIVVEKGNQRELITALEEIRLRGKKNYSTHCRAYAIQNFQKEDCFRKYINIYESLA